MPGRNSGLTSDDRALRLTNRVGEAGWRRAPRLSRGLGRLGFELFTGQGGFYHWARLPGELTADRFNERLFEHDAGILPGRLCDMARRPGADCPLDRFVRFSFGPLSPETYDENLEILSRCV